MPRSEAWRLRTEARAAGYVRRHDAGETVAQIAAGEGVSGARVYQVLSDAGMSLRPPPPPYKPAPVSDERPGWSHPSEELVRLAREGRAEMEHAMARLRVPS